MTSGPVIGKRPTLNVEVSIHRKRLTMPAMFSITEATGRESD
jgi:hypothetical protein